MFDLSGKTALVTGANTGLGQAMALALAKAGADIALIGRTKPTQTLEQITKTGVKSVSISADLSRADAVAEIVDTAVSKLGRADILVNNAGIQFVSVDYLVGATVAAVLSCFRIGSIIVVLASVSVFFAIRYF